MSLIVECLYSIGDSVYLRTDKDQRERLVTSIRLYGGNRVAYELSCGTESSYHYEFEMSKERNLTLELQ